MQRTPILFQKFITNKIQISIIIRSIERNFLKLPSKVISQILSPLETFALLGKDSVSQYGWSKLEKNQTTKKKQNETIKKSLQ